MVSQNMEGGIPNGIPKYIGWYPKMVSQSAKVCFSQVITHFPWMQMRKNDVFFQYCIPSRHILGYRLGYHPLDFGIPPSIFWDTILYILGYHLGYHPLYFGISIVIPFGIPFGDSLLSHLGYHLGNHLGYHVNDFGYHLGHHLGYGFGVHIGMSL